MSQKELLSHLNTYRKKHNTFQRSMDERSDKLVSSTYDGPPFASGSPHYGHGLTSTMKDTILRYKTMQGNKVNRDRGRDCHGLPVEKYVEKKLGLDGKRDIEEKLGVEKFVEECRAAVHNVNTEWKRFIENLGRRADIKNAYFTMDLDFMESVLRAFQNLYNQNLIYKGFKVQGYCPSCATSLANNEINEGYKDRQDPAITVKMSISGTTVDKEKNEKYETTTDGFIDVAAGIIKKDGKYCMIHHTKENLRFFPGGKVEKGESLEDTLKRELKEELDIEVNNYKKIGTIKIIHQNTPWRVHFFDIDTNDEPSIQEENAHGAMRWIEKVSSDNELGFAIKVDEVIIDNEEEIMKDFIDFYLMDKGIIQQEGIGDAPMHFLAWTTTPWTLPSNMFLAMGEKIDYVIVWDKDQKEYYILAENLLKKYYKDPAEYMIIYKTKGKEFTKLNYSPLFDYINQSAIAPKYKQQFFQTIAGDFVSIEDGTGIVHLAPAFGQDDFEAVAQLLPRDDAKNWLFLPVDDYGEFDDQMGEFKGIRVYDANKDFIKILKENNKLVAQNTYNHSYPHCRRCETPLIYKAITSWFIKEQELAKQTLPGAEQIHFVPESVKNRFIETLKSAPDWNVSRNRYRGSPLPIWESVDDETKRMVIGTLDELYQQTKTGSKNITKHILIRHGQTDYNAKKSHDSYGKATLTELGHQEAENIVPLLQIKKLEQENTVIVLSPLKRCLETALPYLNTLFDTQTVQTIIQKHGEVEQKHHALYTSNEIISYVKDTNTQKLFQLHQNVYVDMRIFEVVVPEQDDKEKICHRTTSMPNDEKLSPLGECMHDVFARNANYIQDISQQFPTKTIITIAHGDPIVAMRKAFRDFVYNQEKDKYYPRNTQLVTHYRDNDRNTEVDLHKPYIDNYWLTIEGTTYKRIPEVFDCWFESGAMPYGQANYTGEKNNHQQNLTHNRGEIQKKSTNKQFHYPADFIIEGLDQTRGWFRTLHVLGQGIKNQNSFNNVIINGLVLAEDGKKMSKRLQNYPDPKYLFEKYGSDAYRLYLLNSPAVRAEPVRFTEKGVEQIYKDFTTAINNAYNFFSTYAKVDNFVYEKPNIFLIRHAEAEGNHKEAMLTAGGRAMMHTEKTVKKIIRTNPDIIYTSNRSRAHETAKEIQEIIKEYVNKDVEIVVDNDLGFDGDTQSLIDVYHTINNKHKGKNVLIVGHNETFKELWKTLYTTNTPPSISNLDVVPMPTYQVSNELDKWILAELHTVLKEVQNNMDGYHFDGGSKEVLGFVEKLTNWFIRRSRRRFWASGMDQDKLSAYHTLFTVLEQYTKIIAPFAPFISEHIWLKLQAFKPTEQDIEGKSVHLEYYPITSEVYIDQNLREEITLVRKIISLGLFIRSKTKIKIKQPLQKMEVKI